MERVNDGSFQLEDLAQGFRDIEQSDELYENLFEGREDKQGFTLYDATMGSGSLLLNAKRYSRQPQTVVYFGQELNTSHDWTLFSQVVC